MPGLLRHRAGDRARVALEVAGHPGRAEQLAQRGLERAGLAGLQQLALHAGRAQPLDPRGLGGQPGLVRWMISAPLRRIRARSP